MASLVERRAARLVFPSKVELRTEEEEDPPNQKAPIANTKEGKQVSRSKSPLAI